MTLYLVMAFDTYYPGGGISEIKNVTASREAAEISAKAQVTPGALLPASGLPYVYDYAQIIAVSDGSKVLVAEFSRT